MEAPGFSHGEEIASCLNISISVLSVDVGAVFVRYSGNALNSMTRNIDTSRFQTLNYIRAALPSAERLFAYPVCFTIGPLGNTAFDLLHDVFRSIGSCSF